MANITLFGDLGKPATALIEKISEAIGAGFKPFQIKRIAKAEAEADKIKAISQLEISDLQKRALTRFVSEETIKQENMEDIIELALPNLSETAKPKNIENDWIMKFFDNCKYISDDEMQKLWASILVGEANKPGSFSKRTINFMGSLDKKDAVLFTKLCKFNWIIWDKGIPTNFPLVFDKHAEIFKINGFDNAAFFHLSSIGLFDAAVTRWQLTFNQKKVNLYYKDIPYVFEFSKEPPYLLYYGQVTLSIIGAEIASICKTEPIPGFVEYVTTELAKQGIKVLPASMP